MVTAFSIKHPKLTLKITVEEVKKLHIHEEIIPRILSWLVDKIRRDNYFKDPIIVDEKTLVVLDGMHRVAAMEELGYPYIPVCLVDYDNPNIMVGSWCRVVKSGAGGLDRVKSIISGMGFELRPCSRDKIFDILSRRDAISALVSRDECLCIYKPEKDIKRIYDLIKSMEHKLMEEGFEIGYETEKDAMDKALRGEVIASIITPRVSKNEVRMVALRGEVFAHKTTRHVIPARPMNINIPLEWLKGDKPIEEVRKMVVEHLSKKRIRHLPPGQILDRRYEEELYVFE